MSGSGRTICIAGAGIAGLTLALALAKFGAAVVVLERNQAVQEFGAGLQISPNARRALNRLGLDKQLRSRSFQPAGIDIYPFRARRPLTTLTLGPEIAEHFAAPYAVMHRADLAAILHSACKRFANIDIVFGVRSFNAESHNHRVSANIVEGDGSARTARAFAFVGADGVNSPTRTALIEGPRATYAGRVAWRTTLPMAALQDNFVLDRATLLFGPGYHAVCYPLPYRKQVNIALFAPQSETSALGSTPPSAPQWTRAMLRSPHFAAIAAAAEGSWTYWPVSTVHTSQWHKGAIGLVGDAAHAMLPFQAQGAAMAIEDAAILAPLLMTEPDAASAFARYAAIRQPRVDRVRRVSDANGFAFHLGWPFSMARDAVLALQGERGHFRRLDWLYGYDPAPDPAIAATRRRPRP